FREMAEAGCLFSYSVSLKDTWYRSASFVDKILKGAKPSDLPVQQSTKFEFVINLKTAKALGIEVPSGLTARADDVIEGSAASSSGYLAARRRGRLRQVHKTQLSR